MAEKNLYALILGVSSGFGKATAIELAKLGYNIYGVHLDRASNMASVNKTKEEIESIGTKVRFFNVNAADDDKRKEVIEEIKADFANQNSPHLKVVLHSLAFGALGPLIGRKPEEALNKKKIEMTVNVMANSLVYWAQDLFHNGLLKENSRIYAMTSNGSQKVMHNYGAVGAAKSALEAYIRYLSIELGKYKITANSIMAGFTDTPAAKVIPGFDENLVLARKLNPQHRNTEPEDVARMIALLQDDRSGWITGQVIGVDGGEGLVVFTEK